MAPDPVTVLIARQVAPGREFEFQDWAADLTRTASGFAGFLGSGLLRPVRSGEPWHVIYRFDTPKHLADWEVSSVRQELLATADHLMETVGVHRVSGLETWFSLPGRTAPAPPRWKMFVASAACIYLLQLLTYAVVGGWVSHWHLALRLAVVVPVVTALMTWVVMPQVTQWLATWLYPLHRNDSRRAETI